MPEVVCMPDEPTSHPEEEIAGPCGSAVEEDEAEEPESPDATVPEGADRRDTSPILLSEVAAEPLQPIPLAKLAPISPPFAALIESPAALAVSPLARPASPAEPAEPLRLQEIPLAESGLLVSEGAPFTGEVLRRARAARGLTVQQICERTKISRHHIDHLEADRYENLPAPVYLRGILMALAKELRLDGQKVARSYLEAATPQAPAKHR